jgi:hypothetical protein
MFRRALIIAALTNLGPVPPVPAAAQGNEFLAALFGVLPRTGESFACFSRQYDEAQLAARPGQRVAFVKALIATYYRQSSLGPQTGAYSYQVSLAFRFRDSANVLTGVAECGEGRVRDSLRGGAFCAGPRRSSWPQGTAGSRRDDSQRRRSLGARSAGEASRHDQESIRPRRQDLSPRPNGPPRMRGSRLRPVEAPASPQAQTRPGRRDADRVGAVRNWG